jgi:hypothetical protein
MTNTIQYTLYIEKLEWDPKSVCLKTTRTKLKESGIYDLRRDNEILVIGKTRNIIFQFSSRNEDNGKLYFRPTFESGLYEIYLLVVEDK